MSDIQKKLKENPEEFIQEKVDRIVEKLAHVAAGDFSVRFDIDEDDPFAEAAEAFNVMFEDVEFMNKELEQKNEKLEEKLDVIENQKEAMAELSTPTVQIWDGVLTLPIIGVLDSQRTQQMMEVLLEEIVNREARYVIIDITGVGYVDTKTADHLVKISKAVHLLGSECIITGMQPEVSNTLVQIGVDFEGLITMRNISDALKYVFDELEVEL